VTRKIKFREKRNKYLAKHRRQIRRDNIFTSVIDISFPAKIYTWKEVQRWWA
jgi:hypothetical protein